MNIEEILIKHEGLKLTPYYDTVGKLTIGVGRNLTDNGISKEEALLLLNNDIKRSIKELEDIFDDFNNLPENIQIVLIDMIFNLGKPKFLKFKKMIKAVKNKDWKKMKEEIINSKWCRELLNRCKDNQKIINDIIKNNKRVEKDAT